MPDRKSDLDTLTTEALEECERWLAYLDSREDRTRQLQEAAKLSRGGNRSAALEMKKLADANLQTYDASRLRGAVKHLVKITRE